MTNPWPPIDRDAKSGEFFDAAAAGKLLLKTCDTCAHALAPESQLCTACHGTRLSWAPASGAGLLVSWTVVHRAPNHMYTDVVPYTVGIVELAEGPWLYARIVTAAPRCGAPLHAEFVHPEDGESYPIFVEAVSQ